MRKASRALREILDRLGREGLNSPGWARRYGLRTSDRPVSHRRSRITEGHSNDSPTASLLWRRQPASRTSPFLGRGTAPSENKSTFWVIPHTHWEGAVFKTRAEYLEMGLPHILKPMKRLKQQPDYRFVLDQVAYVKPSLERYPDQERDFRKFLTKGRLQLVGGLDEFGDSILNLSELGMVSLRQESLGKVAYVKPFLERYPDQERDFRRFLAEGRLQLVGGLDEFRGQHT